jgi:AraC-like DNA-binding protein
MRIGLDGANRLRGFFESFREALSAGVTDPAVALAAEDELRDRVSSVLGGQIAGDDGCTQHLGRPVIQRNHIIRRCLELLSSRDSLPLSMRDLCAAAGVPERTLRSAFTEYFGVGPMRLLKARQLQEVRRALLTADPRSILLQAWHKAGVFGTSAIFRAVTACCTQRCRQLHWPGAP